MKAHKIIRREHHIYTCNVKNDRIYKIIKINDGGNTDFINAFIWKRGENFDCVTKRNNFYFGINFNVLNGKIFECQEMPKGTVVFWNNGLSKKVL
jgi:hypothetical protein